MDIDHHEHGGSPEAGGGLPGRGVGHHGAQLGEVHCVHVLESQSSYISTAVWNAGTHISHQQAIMLL